MLKVIPRPRLSLVPDKLSCDTIDLLEQLLDSARRGHLVGLACIGMYKGDEWIAQTAGEAYRRPVLARGAVAALDDYLADIARS